MIAPRLSALKDRFGPQGLAVVGITTDDAEQAAVFAERHQMHYPVVVDKDGETSRAYNVTGLPTMILIDKQGVVRDVFIGFDPGGDVALEAAVRKLLAEPAGAGAVRRRRRHFPLSRDPKVVESREPRRARAQSSRWRARQMPSDGTPTSWILPLKALADPDVVLRVDDHGADALDRLDQLQPLFRAEDEDGVVDLVGEERRRRPDRHAPARRCRVARARIDDVVIALAAHDVRSARSRPPC